MVGPLGYLVFTDCIGLRKQGRDRRSVIVEYNPGQELEVYQSTPDMELFVDEGVVMVLDKDRKETTWDKLIPDEDPPKQQTLIVNKVKPTKVKELRAETRPVRKRK